MNALLKTELSPFRSGRITGSRVGAILGLNPYSTRADVLREMVRQHYGADQEFTGNEATAHGERCEPLALAMYEEQRGVMTYGGGELLIAPEYDFLAVTPDGLVEHDGMVECKAPFSSNYTSWVDRPYYAAQMRLQMAVAGRQWCDFVVYRDGEIAVSRISHDPNWLPSVLPALQEFMADFRAAIASDEAAAPYLADLVAEMDSNEWKHWTHTYLDKKREAEQATKYADEARSKLIAMAEKAGAKSARGYGISVTRSERAGSVAYAKAIKDLAPGADLSKYTGKPTITYTIRETN